MTLTEVVIAVLLVVGLAGIIVPVLPGSVLIVVAVLIWAGEVGTTQAWIVFAVATVFIALGTVVKYAVPGRQLKEAGVPRRTLLIGALVGIIGFFVVPVLGLFLGFVLGVYIAERQRVGAEAAWPATKHALKAVGISILIELAAAVLAIGTWVVGVLVT